MNRRKTSLAGLTIGALLVVSAIGASFAAGQSARDILERVDDLYRSKSSRARMVMEVVTKHWSRKLVMEAWTKGKEKSLVRILAPKKEKGMATLKVGNDIWNWLPKVKRVMKVPSSMMSDSWMGSHFTNDDMVKESRMAEDYDFKMTFRGEREGKKVVEIECTPKPQAPVEWGKVVVMVEDGTWIPLKVLYYDEEGDLARTFIFGSVKKMGGRTIPAEMRVVPAGKPGEYTFVRYEKIEFD
ncbi:MAG: outer membrane lipoprotein-sorting protein, partial [Deltaproteobacteria bacterium]